MNLNDGKGIIPLSYLVLAFLFLSVGVVFSGSVYFVNYKNHFYQEMQQNLATVADLKVETLARWQKERLGDAAVFYHNRVFVEQVQAFYDCSDDPAASQALRDWLDQTRQAYLYDHIYLYDTAAKTRMAIPDDGQAAGDYLAGLVPGVLQSGQVSFVDFYRDTPEGPVFISLLVPLLSDTKAEPPVGVLALRMNVQQNIFPSIQFWPEAGQSTDTALVRREGQDVLLLNDLRREKNTALKLRISQEKTDAVGVKAVLGARGLAEGKDHRNVPVIAYISSVPETSWFLITYIDKTEVSASLNERLALVVVLGCALLFIFAAILGLVWRRQNWLLALSDIRELKRSETITRRVNRLLEMLSEISQITLMVRDRAELFERISQIVIEKGGYSLLWIGLLDNPQGKLGAVSATGEAGRLAGQLETAFNESGDTSLPFLSLWRSGKSWVSNNIEVELEGSSLFKELAAPGFCSAGAFPLIVSGNPAGVVFLCAGSGQSIHEDEARLLEEMARNISLALEFARQNEVRLSAEQELRMSEERLRAFFNSGIFGAVWGDIKGTIYDANDEYFRITGYSRQEMLEKTIRWSDLTPPEFLPLDEYASAQARKTGACTPFEKQYIRKDGSRIWVLVGFVLIGEKQDESIAFVLDLTSAKQKEQEINKLNAELEQRVQERTRELEFSIKELESFAYSVAHDLRSPLRAIAGYSGIIRDEYAAVLDEEVQVLLEKVQNNILKMDRLISDLLALSRTTRAEMTYSNIDMTALARYAYRQTASLDIQEAFVFELAQLPEAYGDQALLMRVWVNLISNAIKYTLPMKEKRIEIGSYAETGANVYYVRDTGVGFDPNFKDKLFGIFQSLHRVEEFSGTGMGLAIVERIIYRHGGRVWADGKVNDGATFYFSLPRREAEA